MEGAGGIDFPSLGRPPVSSRLDAMSFGCAPFACGIKVLQTEADGVDLAMETGTLGFFLMGPEPFAGGGGSFNRYRNTHAPRSTGLLSTPSLPMA